jgi:SAM-dependent methyltransferase
MSPDVFKAFADITASRLVEINISAVLEIGASAWTLLSIPRFQSARRVALNPRFDKISADLEKTERVIGNSNQLQFPDETFDCILSCSTLEHDRYFWKSIAETKRVLKKGGYFIVGVPIYMTLPSDRDFTTVTYARHGLAYNADFYRYSEQAVREVFFEGYEEVTDEVIVRRLPNPFLVAAGKK